MKGPGGKSLALLLDSKIITLLYLAKLAIAREEVAMARKPTVDVDKVMQMLREGESTQSVADRFGVSRQAIDLHRRKFIQSGQLVEKRAPRHTLASPGPAEAGIKEAQAGAMPKPAERGTSGYHAGPSQESAMAAKPPEIVSLDRMIELIIEAFDSLKQVPKLEAELEKYRREYQKAAEKIEQLEQAVSKRNEQEARWRLVVPPEGGKPGS